MQIVDEQTGQPLPGATVQRYYPVSQGGGIYSSPVIADSNGVANGRVPDRNYFWIVTNVGYADKRVDLTNAISSDNVQGTVKMQRKADELDPVVITPNSGGGMSKGMIAVLIAVGVGYYGHIKKWW